MDIVTEAKISISISIENSRGLDVFLYKVFKWLRNLNSL